MLGIPFFIAGERIRRLGEALTVCRKLWTEEHASFDGSYYTLTDAVANLSRCSGRTPRSGSAAQASS
jgi:alkanesulfonate monooxygenase SsuD/methylene tetrahydromethanopterin reductase-like flavin-dependent oxidoreductase (luciferase family)